MYEKIKLIIDYFRGEWAQLKSAPFSFVVTLLIAIAIAYIVCNWRAQAIIDQLREQNTTLTLQLNVKNDIIDEYRQRLHIVPIGKKIYSQLSHSELRQKITSFLVEVRDYLKQRRKVESELLLDSISFFPDPNDPSSIKLFQENTNRLIQSGIKWDDLFNRQYRSEFIVLWQEVKSRLPEGIELPKEHYLSMTNTIVLERAIADLEVLMKSLPK